MGAFVRDGNVRKKKRLCVNRAIDRLEKRITQIAEEEAARAEAEKEAARRAADDARKQ